ncbi:polysaccharide deacetylase family protein [Alicyclobacillus ferrooxydans]|uniref:polysaccharide deacetylase family protein n=1 Tax=Alicyclobacillus ferrooxydans TaxID=471514 RepID=UPI0006D55D1C|nr:polysaccharide deacetylase family protein [Alicyclobacillus ferrooxydans]
MNQYRRKHAIGSAIVVAAVTVLNVNDAVITAIARDCGSSVSDTNGRASNLSVTSGCASSVRVTRGHVSSVSVTNEPGSGLSVSVTNGRSGTVNANENGTTGSRVEPGDPSHISGSDSTIYYRNKVVVLTYHDISPNVYSPFVMTPKAFAAQLDAFQKRDFHVITNAEFIRFINGQGPVPPNAILLTFDDGYRNMYTYALPILMKYHVQGTFFVIVGTADKQDPKTLSWSQIQTMEQEGMTFGSHTYDAHSLIFRHGELTPVFNTTIVVNGHLETEHQYYTRVQVDFVKARARLSEVLGVNVVEFAWPYGYGNSASNRIARRAGYQYLFTTAPGYVTAQSNPHFIHRIDVGKTNITPKEAVQRILDTGRFMPWLYHRE